MTMYQSAIEEGNFDEEAIFHAIERRNVDLLISLINHGFDLNEPQRSVRLDRPLFLSLLSLFSQFV